MTNTKQKTTIEQRNLILTLLIANKYQEANGAAHVLGFSEGITAEFFEHVIAHDGFHNEVIRASAVYYFDEAKADLVKAHSVVVQ